MTKVTQPTAAPTRKLSAAIIAAAVIETARVVTDAIWPGLADGPFWIAILPVAIWFVGFWVKDEANA